MPKDIFPQPTPELAARRRQLVPDTHDAFMKFSERVFAAGALPVKIKQLIAVAAAHVTQCPYCIRGHTKAALREGTTAEEIMLCSLPNRPLAVERPVRLESGTRAAPSTAACLDLRHEKCT